MYRYSRLLRPAFFIVLLVVTIGIRVQAQDSAVAIQDKVQIQSTILKKSRSLIVHKPSSYEDGTTMNGRSRSSKKWVPTMTL